MNGSNGVTKGPLYGALDRFAQFFVAPLFLASTLDRELRAVDSENKKNLQSDVWRLSQLAKTLSNPKHPYHHFSTGNLKTLRDDPQARGVEIRDEFIKFYEKHYSANRMKLVVLGKEDLDVLEGWVVELFSDVKDKNLQPNRWDGQQPFGEDQLKTAVFAKPVMESRSLEISFSYQDEEDMFESQPSRYLSHLIGHEGPGSILAYLRGQGLANSLSAGGHTICPGSGFFEIDINLTPEGLKKYQDVVKIVFQYISLVKDTPPVEWMFQEQKNMADVEFKFRQKSPASRFASSMSSVMQKPLPRELLLSGTSRLRKFDADAIVNALSFLREDNCRLMIVSNDFPGDWNQKEKWYGTDYKVERIPDELLAEIKQSMSDPSKRPSELFLPHKNEFIPTRLDVEKQDVPEPAKAPKLLRDDASVRLWYKKDDTFWVPKSHINILLRTPLAYESPANHVKSALFVNLVKDTLEEYAYDAEISGLNYSLTSNSMGIELNIHGYNDKLNVLLEKILTTFREADLRQSRFDIYKERFEREYKNWGYRQPYTQVGDHSRYLLDEKRYINDEYAAELSHITLDELKSFSQRLISQAHIEILVHGNSYREETLRVADLVETTLRPRTLPSSQWPVRRNVLLQPGSNYVYEHTLTDPENVNSCIEYYLQVGSNMDAGLRAKVQILAQLTDEPSFDTLRTKEQLGYVVWSGSRPSATMTGYRVLIQSEKSPEYLESRIEAFLVKFKQDLQSMSQEAYEQHKKALIARKSESLKNLSSETNRLWGYILGEGYNFLQIDADCKAIRQITKDDMEAFFAEFIDPASKSRRKLSIHLRAKKVVSDQPTSDKKAELLPLLTKYFASKGVDVDEEKVNTAFADVAVHDQAGILTASKSIIGKSLPESPTKEVLQEIETILPQVFAQLKIQAPEQEPLSAAPPQLIEPVLVTDVHRWKTGLQVSQGTLPAVDIKIYRDFESKL